MLLSKKPLHKPRKNYWLEKVSKKFTMKTVFPILLSSFLTTNINLLGQVSLEKLKTEVEKVIPKDLEAEEIGTDKANLYLIYYKSAQEALTFNPQRNYLIYF